MTSRNHQLATPANVAPPPRDRRLRRAALFVAAGVVSAVLADSAPAQQLQDNGRALDANPRAGSFGRNDGVGARAIGGQMVTGNQIVTGNVTAGRQFRDFTGYSDPAAFRGPTAGSFSSDRFIRDSAGVPRGVATGQVDMSRPTAYYGSQLATPPPVGYVRAGAGNVGYVPSSPAVVNPGLGGQTFDLGLNNSVRPGELVLPTIDAANQQTLLSASPLYGVRVWGAGQGPNDFLVPGMPGQQGNGQPGQALDQGMPNSGDRFRMDPNSIQRMRDELNGAGGDQGQQDQGQGGAGAGQAGLVQPLSSNAIGSAGAGAGAGAGADAGSGAGASGAGAAGNSLQTQTLTSDLRPTAIGGGAINTNQGIRYRLLVSPEKQTPQLAEMRKRFERQFGDGAAVGNLEANRQYNLERMAQQQPPAEGRGGPNDRPGGPGGARRPGAARGAAGGAGGGGGGGGNVGAVPSLPPSGSGGAAPAPGETGAPTPPAEPGSNPGALGTPPGPAPAAVPAEPMQIKSLAADVQAKGLRDLLASAEDLMRQQKYAAALDKYQAARDVAPNNPLIILGRAHAELAASYYRRAETDLRDALAQAPHLVQAQFDLRNLVGPERLQIVVKDLKELAAADAQQSRPLMLLAYIAYNTGNQEQAVGYLDAAEKRVQGDDPMLKAWRRYWKLPNAAGGAEAAPDATSK